VAIEKHLQTPIHRQEIQSFEEVGELARKYIDSK